MKNIIIKLQGGLGNQLFQFALGKNLAIKTNSSLLLDKSMFKYYKLHAFSLSPFKIQENFALKKEIPIQYWYNDKILRNSFKLIDPLIYKNKIVKEKTMNFDESIINMDINGRVYLDGYWQSEKYFIQNVEEIRSSLALKNVITDSDIIKLNNEIDTSNSVSIHIRRGNYTLLETQKIHGLAPLDYYDKAISYIRTKINDPKFFIFSDDYNWVSEKFRDLSNSVIVKSSVDKDYLDMFLMSQCKHNIIANSTFSWWSAWLNSHKDKIVVAPNKWYNTPYLNTQTIDLIPDKWIRL